MSEFSEKAYGKLNLSLDVTGRRGDGYHMVRMVMQTVDICDTITITMAAAGSPDLEVTSDNGVIPAGPSNLVWQAAEVMRRTYRLTEGLSIRIEKQIPIAAGMAGGSADAAAVMRLMRSMYRLPVPDEELRRLALPLGADIPFCIAGGTQLCEGIGEVLTPLPVLPDCVLLVVKPNVDVSTGWVYRAFDGLPADEIHHPDVDEMVRAIRAGDLGGVCRCLGNVLEQKTGAVYPVIGELERFLLERGACGSIMTGSGPTVFGIYDDREKADRAFAMLQAEPAYRSFMKFKTFIWPSQHALPFGSCP